MNIFNTENRTNVNYKDQVVYPWYIGTEHTDTKPLGGMTFDQYEAMYHDPGTVIVPLRKEVYSGKLYSKTELVIGNYGDDNCPAIVRYQNCSKENAAAVYTMGETDVEDVWRYLCKKALNK